MIDRHSQFSENTLVRHDTNICLISDYIVVLDALGVLNFVFDRMCGMRFVTSSNISKDFPTSKNG